MDTKKLTMSEADVKTAIVDAFKKQFSNLVFKTGQVFDKFDPNFTYHVDFLKPYQYKGDYPIGMTVKLFEKECMSRLYDIEAIINIDEEDNAPKIKFISPLSARLHL